MLVNGKSPAGLDGERYLQGTPGTVRGVRPWWAPSLSLQSFDWRVPISYLDTYRNEQGALPLYFNPRDLVADWQRSTNNADSNNAIPPRIQGRIRMNYLAVS